MPLPPITRRSLLLGSGAALGCAVKKPTGFPGYCFVANRAGRSLSVVDLDRFRLGRQIPLDAAPAALITRADAAKPRVYVLAPEAGMVYEVDANALAVSRKAWVGNQPLSMQLSAAGDALWVLCREPGALVELPMNTFRPGRRIALAAQPDAFDLSADGRAAIISRRGKTITVASLPRATVLNSIQAPGEPSIVQFRRDGQQVIAGSAADRSLDVFDATNGKIVVRLPLPLAPRHFCASSDGGQIFVTGDGMDAVVIAFPYLTEIDQTMLAGHAPGVMAVTGNETSPTPSYLLAANQESNTITVLDVDTRRLVAVVQVGQSPAEIVVTPDNQYALVIGEQSGDLAVIRLASFADAWVRRYKSASLFTMIPVGRSPVAAAVVSVRH